jgi:glycosyltransferase involved in cell wall biosynthesis
MKILQIVPGTATFYCGSCIRDTALCTAMRQRGIDVLLQPLYLPLLSEQTSTEVNDSIFFGGINVYLQQKIDFFQKTPRWIDRIFDTRSLLKLSATQVGMTKPEELGEMTISMLQGMEGRQTKEISRFIAWAKEQGTMDAIIFPNVMLLGLAPVIQKELQIPIFCTVQGEDSFLDSLPDHYSKQAWNLIKQCAKSVNAFIPVSHYYGDVMKKRLDLHEDQCFVIQNGISLDGFNGVRKQTDDLNLGFLAHLRKEKGLDTLAEAFIRLKAKTEFLNLKLRIAGTVTNADQPFISHIKQRLTNANCINDVEFLTNISRKEKIEFLESLTVLSVPATYGESFGLYVLEALACGVPVVQPDHAAFPEIIEKTGGGLLYKPHDLDSYVSTLSRLLLNREENQKMGRQGQIVVQEYFTVDRMVDDLIQFMEHTLNR